MRLLFLSVVLYMCLVMFIGKAETEIHNSSIQPWLDFEGKTLPATISPCKTGILSDDYQRLQGLPDGDCSQICNDTHILDQYSAETGTNLLTCGLWASVAMLESYRSQLESHYSSAIASGYGFAGNDEYTSMLSRFESFGLDANDTAFVFATRNAISFVMSDMLKDTTISSTSTSFGGVCSEQGLFPELDSLMLHTIAVGVQIQSSVRTCLDAICSPKRLNSDLGGIGVFISLLMQNCIIIFIVAGLLVCAFWPYSLKKRKLHMLNLATGLVEFHKAQCYLLSAIQVANLYLSAQTYINIERLDTTGIFDNLLSVPLSLNGVIPVILSLSCIAIYARLSWHILILTTISVGLSTSALTLTYRGVFSYRSRAASDDILFYSSTKATLINSVCGSQKTNLQHLPGSREFNFGIVWTVYAYCLCWFTWCFLNQLSRSCRNAPWVQSLRPNFAKFRFYSSSNQVFTRKAATSLATSLLLLMWAFCLAYPFYLYSLFTRANMVSPTWSFGQIIAVTVWVPSIVEFFYIEHEGLEKGSRYRYPRGVQAFIYRFSGSRPGDEDADVGGVNTRRMEEELEVQSKRSGHSLRTDAELGVMSLASVVPRVD